MGILDALFSDAQSDPWKGLREVSNSPNIQPMQSAQPQQQAQAGGIFGALQNLVSGGNAQPESYQGAQMMQAPQQASQQPAQQRSGSIRNLLTALGPAIAMLDPRNQQLSAYLMERQQNRQWEAAGQERANKTREYMVAQGVDPAEADALVADPQLLRGWFSERAKAGKPDWQITEIYDEQGRAKKVLIDKNNPQNMQNLGGSKAASGADGVEYGLNPIWGQDQNGEPVLGVLGKDGSFKKVDTGKFNISTGTEQIDLGDSYALKDKRSGQIIGTVPKNLSNAAQETAIGKALGEAKGEAQVSLGSTLQKADQSISLIDTMLEHPGLSTATGLSGTVDPRNYIAGTDATNFNVMRKQLEGKAFLEAFESLKGGGQITEIEGQKATEAIARLSTTQSEKAYREALTELRGILQQGKVRAQQMAGAGANSQQTSPSGSGRLRFNPSTGDFE